MELIIFLAVLSVLAFIFGIWGCFQLRKEDRKMVHNTK